MKKTLILLPLVLSLAVTGCASNTTSQNMAVGAVAGGVLGGVAGSLIGSGTGQAVAIGAGIVGGALLGSYIGGQMDSVDKRNMYTVLSNNAPNQPYTWTNAKTHTTYTILPTTQRVPMYGMTDCRKYRATVIINGRAQERFGTACMQADGTWRAVN